MTKPGKDDGKGFVVGEWLQTRGADSDVAVCTRVRLARNVRGYRFPGAQDEAEARDLVQHVRERIESAGMPEPLMAAELASVSELELQLLVERHLISRELAASKRHRSVAVNPAESIALMINEEDHLRLQVFASGFQAKAAWLRAEALDDALVQRLPLAFHESFGFLTSCPTNAGTGLRLSVMLHLPALVWSDQVEKLTNVAQKIHLAVRGLYGEGSRAIGDFYQVSNQVTLGRTEDEIVDEVSLAVTKFMAWERELRKTLLEGAARVRTLDRVHRALGVVERAKILSSDEAMTCMSALRFGCHAGLLDQFEAMDLNRALLVSQPAHLQRYRGSELDPTERDEVRASLVRQFLRLEG